MPKIYWTLPEKSGQVRRISHCASCTAKCDMDPPVVGCETIYSPGRLEIKGKVYRWFCDRRVWFDRNYRPTEVWDPSIIDENMTPEKFWRLMEEELKRLQLEADKIERRTTA